MNTVELVKNRLKRVIAKLDDDMVRVKMNEALSEEEKEAELMILRAIKSLANGQGVAELTQLQIDKAATLESDLDAICVEVNKTIAKVMAGQRPKRSVMYEIKIAEPGYKRSKNHWIAPRKGDS